MDDLRDDLVGEFAAITQNLQENGNGLVCIRHVLGALRTSCIYHSSLHRIILSLCLSHLGAHLRGNILFEARENRLNRSIILYLFKLFHKFREVLRGRIKVVERVNHVEHD